MTWSLLRGEFAVVLLEELVGVQFLGPLEPRVDGGGPRRQAERGDPGLHRRAAVHLAEHRQRHTSSTHSWSAPPVWNRSFGPRAGLNRGVLRGVRVVAVDAVVPHPAALRQVPVPGHAAVRPVLVVAVLRAVALGAQRHHLRVRQRLAVREPQRGVPVGRVVARRCTTGSRACRSEPWWKVASGDAQFASGVRGLGCVAGRARNENGLPFLVEGARPDSGRARGLADNGRVRRKGRRGMLGRLCGAGLCEFRAHPASACAIAAHARAQNVRALRPPHLAGRTVEIHVISGQTPSNSANPALSLGSGTRTAY